MGEIVLLGSESRGKPVLGLALSGGGARGLAHIGVLRMLEREGVTVACVAGTSMGGIIAAAYAAGMSVDDIEREAWAATRWRRMLGLADPGFLDRGLLRGEHVLAYFHRLLGERTFAELRVPLALVAVDLNTGQEVVLREGRVADALRATMSIPGVFTPLERDGRRLVDGGVLNNLPVDVVRDMGADVVIASDVGQQAGEGASYWEENPRWVPVGVRSTIKSLTDTTMAMMSAMAHYKVEAAQPDVLIRPQCPAGVNAFAGYARVRELIAAGEAATEELLPEIRARLRIAV